MAKPARFVSRPTDDEPDFVPHTRYRSPEFGKEQEPPVKVPAAVVPLYSEDEADIVEHLRDALTETCKAQWRKTLEDPGVRSRALATMSRVFREVRRHEEIYSYCREIDAIVEAMSSDLTDVCEELQATGYPEVSVWLTNPENNALQCVAGGGLTPRDFHHLRRGIRDDSRLNDIVVEVAKRKVAERVVGGHLHPLYDAELWLKERHHRFKDRLFIPLLVFRSPGGGFRRACCCWSKSEDSDTWSWESADPTLEVEVIGTLSLSSESEVSVRPIEKILELSLGIAARVYGATLQGAVDRLLAVLCEASGAPSATMHIVPGGDALRYFGTDADKRGNTDLCYVARRFEGARRDGQRPPGTIGGPPRSRGLGVDALRDGLPRHLAGLELELHNPGLWQDGVRGLSVYPLRTWRDSHGLVYIHQFDPEHDLHTDRDFEFLVDRVCHAVSQLVRAFEHRRKLLERAATNHMIKEFLVSDGARNPEPHGEKELLEALGATWVTFLGADAVHIRTSTGVIASAGRLRIDEATASELSGEPTTFRDRNGTLWERVSALAAGEIISVVWLGYGKGNSVADRKLITKVVGLGAHAIKLSQIEKQADRQVVYAQALNEFTRPKDLR